MSFRFFGIEGEPVAKSRIASQLAKVLREIPTKHQHMTKAKGLWTCPECGHKFVTDDVWHSCGNFDFDHHFEGKESIVREMFLKFRRMAESCGAVTCYPQKT
jgi:hypothetical protein